ncbi:MAG: Spy/CpxP family protein refolding chaperone [Caulobacteraceae bacterium]|nr:Spy/CpxP family protein refolding chaperone [Caulobacteraceae bacterium]
MRSTIRVLASLAALSAAVCVSSVSFAQEPPPGGAPPPPAAGGHEHWAERMREHAEARAKALRAILNLRPDQEPAFQAFLASMKPEHPEGMPEHPGMDHPDMNAMDHPDMDAMEQLTTPQRLDKMAARMAEHQAEFQRRAEAIKRFYAVLSPEQQRAFDALHGLMGHGPEGREGPGAPGPGPGPHGMD